MSDGSSAERAGDGQGKPTRSLHFPLLMAGLLAAFCFLPRVHDNSRLMLAFLAAAGALMLGVLLLWAWAKARGRSLRIEYQKPRAAHFIQAGVQASLYAYWGYFWPEIYHEAPLILAQMVFLLVFDGLVSWARGWNWRVSMVPVPIILSTNLFLWFRDDFYIYQFVVITLIVLAKHFLTWKRDGRTTHIFNPSAFGLSLVSIVIILTGTTAQTWARELSTTITEPPYIYLYIFSIGLIVQYFFGITLMVMSTAITLALMNIIYTQITGVYHFGNTHIAASVFLGLHLLLTDPSTSPRTKLGRVVFGVGYAIGYWFMFDTLGRLGAPELYAKLFPVPILNILTIVIERFTRTGLFGRINKAWESAGSAKKLNLIHMGIWAGAFAIMAGTGFLGGRHPGDSIIFWKIAQQEGRHEAGRKLIMVAGARAHSGSGIDANELGVICMEGDLVDFNPRAANKYFAMGCELGDMNACANLAMQFLFRREWLPDNEDDVQRALEALEASCTQQGDGLGCYLLGVAYEHGYGRLKDPARALEQYSRLANNPYAAKGIARIVLSTDHRLRDMRMVIASLEMAGQQGDAEALWCLAYLFRDGVGVQKQPELAAAIMARACAMGNAQACQAAQVEGLPEYQDPKPILVPGWRSVFEGMDLEALKRALHESKRAG